MSLGARLFNMFTTPGEVFDEIKAGRSSVANWLAPVLLSIAVGIFYLVVVFSQEPIVYKVRQQQEQAMEKKLSKMPKEQREQIIQTSQKFMTPTVLILIGSVSTVFFGFGWVFLVGLALWLVGRFILKGTFDYLQAVEVCGLAGMIGVLGALVGMLLSVITSNPNMTLSPALLVREFDPANHVHALLVAVNVLTFWYIAVLALGLARLSGSSWLTATLWLFLPYAAIRVGLIFLGFSLLGF
jgi:hypothetical protein